MICDSDDVDNYDDDDGSDDNDDDDDSDDAQLPDGDAIVAPPPKNALAPPIT